MVKRPAARRGEIWITQLDPTIGREIQKTRPCIVISPDSMNRFLDTLTVMPMTSGSKAAPFRVPVNFGERDGFLLLEQTRSVDRYRLQKKVGELDKVALARTLMVLREMFEE